MCGSRPWFNLVFAIAHKAKAFDLHFNMKPYGLVEMATQTDHEGTENDVYEDGVSDLSR